MFGTTSIPVRDTSMGSVRDPYRYGEYRYLTGYTLDIFCLRSNPGGSNINTNILKPQRSTWLGSWCFHQYRDMLCWQLVRYKTGYGIFSKCISWIWSSAIFCLVFVNFLPSWRTRDFRYYRCKRSKAHKVCTWDLCLQQLPITKKTRGGRPRVVSE